MSAKNVGDKDSYLPIYELLFDQFHNVIEISCISMLGEGKLCVCLHLHVHICEFVLHIYEDFILLFFGF